MSLMREILRTENGNKFLLAITERYSMLTKVVSMSTTSAFLVGKAFVSNWVVNFGSPAVLVTDNGPNLNAKFKQ